MRLRPLIGLITAAVLAVPTAASALPFTISIDGVNPLTLIAPPPGPPGPDPNNPYPGVFVGLGDCVPAGPNACTGVPPISNNPLMSPLDVANQNSLFGTTYSNAAIAGFGFPVDQVVFHTFQTTFSLAGGVFKQDFDFVVGNTGGGSAGLPVPPFSFDYLVDLARNVTVTGPTITRTHLIHQKARVTVSFGDEDTLLIYATDDPLFGTGGPEVFDLLGDGMVSVALGGAGPLPQGDPDTAVIISAVPLPSTLALLGLGLAGLLRGRRIALR